MIKAVVFDMDGLMFDTEALTKKGWMIIGREMGVPIDRDLYRLAIGLNIDGTRQLFRERLGPSFNYDLFQKEVSVYLRHALDQDGLPIKRGLPELLSFLKTEDIPAAVASSSHRHVVEDYLRRADLDFVFSSLICGDMIKKGKPDPEIFLKAAEMLRLKPEECLVLEDSANGIRAADKAGMPVVMIPDLIPPDEELRSKSAAVLRSLLDVIPFLRSQMKRTD